MFENIKAKQYLAQINKAVEGSSRDIPIFNENRDFVEFELMFYFSFVYDYKIYHKMTPTLRNAINKLFIGEILEVRKPNLAKAELERLFDNRMEAYFTFVKQSKKVADFLHRASDYINAMLTISIDENGYADGNRNHLHKIKEVIRPNIHTESIEQTLSLNSGVLLQWELKVSGWNRRRFSINWWISELVDT